MNNYLNDIFDWLCCNRLTLNLSKTNYVISQPRQKLNYNLYSPLALADQILPQFRSVKYLDMYILKVTYVGTIILITYVVRLVRI